MEFIGDSDNQLDKYRPQTVRAWVRKFGKSDSDAFPGKGKLHPGDEELREMKKKIKDLEEENLILKKAMAIVCHDADAQEQGTACCTRDEGGPLGIAVQAEISNHLKVLSGKPVVLSGSCIIKFAI